MYLSNVYTTDAYGFLWELLLERRPDSSISHRKMPGMREHVAFVDSKPYRVWYIIEADNADADDVWVGQVNLTHRNEVGIQILQRYQGKGYGKWAVQSITARHSPLQSQPSLVPGKYIANINPENQASVAFFKSLGGTLLQVTYQLPGELR